MNFYTLIFNSRLSYKRAALFIVVLSFIFINSIAIINYIVDPMWIFKHNGYFDLKKIDWNERQQKTNYLYFKDNHYENTILGSSRTTYLNANEFKKYLGKTFNYAANAMSPYEYKLFLENFKKLVGREPKNIILGLDFFGANKNRIINNHKNEYINNSSDIFYRLKILYSLDTLKYSFYNIKETFRDKKSYYNSDYIKMIDTQKNKQATLKDFIPFEYDENLLDYYKNLQEKYKNSNFIIFTPPVDIEQIKKNHNNGLDKYYFRWLRDLVKIFGKVNHFLYPSEFTKNYNNFYDANHFHHISGKILAKDIIKGFTGSLEHGVLLDKNNIEIFIEKYKALIQKDQQ